MLKDDDIEEINEDNCEDFGNSENDEVNIFEEDFSTKDENISEVLENNIEEYFEFIIEDDLDNDSDLIEKIVVEILKVEILGKEIIEDDNINEDKLIFFSIFSLKELGIVDFFDEKDDDGFNDDIFIFVSNISGIDDFNIFDDINDFSNVDFFIDEEFNDVDGIIKVDFIVK